MKKIFLILLIFAGIFLILQPLPFGQKKNERIPVPQEKKKRAVEQKINNGEIKKYEIEEGKTALDLLQQSSKVKTKGERENAYIIEINGRKADDAKKEFWSLYINGTIAPVGAGSYVLKNGDDIEWKIETY